MRRGTRVAVVSGRYVGAVGWVAEDPDLYNLWNLCPMLEVWFDPWTPGVTAEIGTIQVWWWQVRRVA